MVGSFFWRLQCAPGQWDCSSQYPLWALKVSEEVRHLIMGLLKAFMKHFLLPPEEQSLAMPGLSSFLEPGGRHVNTVGSWVRLVPPCWRDWSGKGRWHWLQQPLSVCWHTHTTRPHSLANGTLANERLKAFLSVCLCSCWRRLLSQGPAVNIYLGLQQFAVAQASP